MEVIHKSPGPGVENCDEPGLTLQAPLRVGRKGTEGFIDGCEEHVNHDFHIAQDQGIEIMGQCEHVVEVTHGKEFGFAIIEPLLFCHRFAFRAMTVAAGVIGVLCKSAFVAFVNMTTHDGCPTVLDSEHDTPLIRREVVVFPIFLPITAEYVGHFRTGFGFRGGVL